MRHLRHSTPHTALACRVKSPQFHSGLGSDVSSFSSKDTVEASEDVLLEQAVQQRTRGYQRCHGEICLDLQFLAEHNLKLRQSRCKRLGLPGGQQLPGFGIALGLYCIVLSRCVVHRFACLVV